MKILMIEDDKMTVEVIRLTLEVHDPNSIITSVEKGREGLETARNERFDVVILDLGLPDIDGMKVLKELRGFSQIPVLVVSARHDPSVITNALNLGAQDYVLKPFNFQTFLSSLKDVIIQPKTGEDQQIYGPITEDLTIDNNTREVFVKGQQIELTENEWRVLNNLLEHCGRIVPVKALAEMLKVDGFSSESVVHLMISQLRKKLGDDPYIPRIIISEYECGYRFIRRKMSENSTCEKIPHSKIAA